MKDEGPALIAKGGSRTVRRDAKGEDRVDYLRLIWIVDYSGPRGAAWPRVSISEPLARVHLRLSLLLCLRSSRTRPALPNLSRASTHVLFPPSPWSVLSGRLLVSSSRFLLAEKFVRFDQAARPAADYMPSRNPMLRESPPSHRPISSLFSKTQNLENLRRWREFAIIMDCIIAAGRLLFRIV